MAARVIWFPLLLIIKAGLWLACNWVRCRDLLPAELRRRLVQVSLFAIFVFRGAGRLHSMTESNWEELSKEVTEVLRTEVE